MTVKSDSTAFSRLEKAIKPLEVEGRTKSASFLVWFLLTIYRMDLMQAQDAVCDSRLDAGIDAIAVSHDRREVVLFQAKRKEKLPGTLGDKDLKGFVGSLAQFEDADTLRKIQSDTENVDFKRLLDEHDIPELIDRGYSIRPIFCSNIAANDHAYKYLDAAREADYEIDLWDLERLGPVLDQLEREWFVDQKVSLEVTEGKLFHIGTKRNPTLIFASVPVKQLVNLPGIADTRLFAQNVRLGLGETRVNQEIIESVKNKKEHGSFLTSHNGLTIVAKNLSIRQNRISMNNYSVCNGCQSMTIFYENRNVLTDEMLVLVRIAHIGDDRSLAELIAYRTNNQNSINLRDLKSNDETQIQLKSEFDELFGFDSTYAIKTGAISESEEISNEFAGQLLLALYVGQAWNAHQKYRVFGNLESKIFRYGIGAAHIRLAQVIMKVIRDEFQSISHERVRRYALTKFIILHFVGVLLRQSDDGVELLINPLPYLNVKDSSDEMENRVLDQIRSIVHIAVAELNYYIREHGDENYDYKREFKSQKFVTAITNEILKGYEKDVYRERAIPFSLPNPNDAA